MARQLTTSAADALLTWSVMFFIYHIFWVNFFACIGLGIQGTAAALGVVRFSQVRLKNKIYDYHLLMSWLAQIVGLPLLAVGFCHKEMPIFMNLNLMIMTAVLISSNFLAPGMRQLATESCTGFAMLTIIIVSLHSLNFYAVLATVVYVAASKVIGSEGIMGMLYRVDVLHAGLAVGNVLFTWSLMEE